ncbi:MAG: YraN family protein [Rhodocyclaceae bacterium]
MDNATGLWQKMRHCLLALAGGQGALTTDATSGGRAESLAAGYLQSQGVRIIARNVRCKGGEIDLIGEHAGTLVFFEVRLRSNLRFGGAAASITPTKQRRIALAARVWLQGDGRSYRQRPMRFDALLLDSLDTASIEWIRGAFSAS